MYCVSCGAQRTDPDSTYCVRCGKPFAAGEQPTVPMTTGPLVGPAASRPPLSEDPASPMAAAPPQHRGIKVLLATVVALVLAILGGTVAIIASHNNTQRQLVTSPTTAETTRPPARPTSAAAQTTAGPGPTQTFPALYRQALAGSCASRPPRETAAASTAGSFWPRTWWPPSLTLSREP